jgi:hypothetical protein
MFANVLRAPTAFFDTTPLGRILNRFSGDVATVDKDLPAATSNFLVLLTKILASVVLQAVVLPFTLIGTFAP